MVSKLFYDRWGEIRMGWVLCLFCVVIIIIPIAIIYLTGSYQCSAYSEMTKRKTEFNALTCYVETEKGMIPYDEMKARAITNE